MAIRVVPDPCRTWCRRHYLVPLAGYVCALAYAVGLRVAAKFLHFSDPPIYITAITGFTVYWLAVVCSRMALFDRNK